MANKIEIGQCYRVDDTVFMVMSESKRLPGGQHYRCIENTLTRQHEDCMEEKLLRMERPFQNFG